jgi:hypothetical protein
MLIMISSYTANLASVLSQKDVSLDFTGWREGSLNVIIRMEDVSLAIPSGMSQTDFIHHEGPIITNLPPGVRRLVYISAKDPPTQSAQNWHSSCY